MKFFIGLPSYEIVMVMFQQTAPHVNRRTQTLNEFEKFVLVPSRKYLPSYAIYLKAGGGGGAHLTSSILLHSSAKFLYSSKTSVHLTCQKRFAKNTIYSTTQIQWTRQKTLL